jgi:putative ABC transport system permease protein
VLYRASFGYLLRHPWQLGLALVGICIGVAVMVAVDLANASSERAFRLSMDTLNGRATHQIVGGPAGVDESLYVRLRVEDGFRDLAPVVEGDIEIGSMSLAVLGVDVFAERGFRRFSSAGNGAARGDELATIRDLLTVRGAMLMSAGTAAALGLGLGDTVPLVAAGRRFDGVLAGVFGEDDSRLDNIVVTDIANGQLWFDRVGYLSRIDVRAQTDDPNAAALAELLPPGYQLLESETRTQATSEMTSAFMTNLTAMSLLAMLVGVFLIYNSVGFAVVQRRGLIGVLRALGLTRQQAFRLILTEGAMLGIVGSALGLAAGVWLGEKLLLLVSQSINDLYFRVTVTEVLLSPVSLLKGAVAGLGATLIAAAVPAAEAAGFEPSLALRRSVLERRTGRAVPMLLAAGLLAMLLAGVLLLASGRSLVAGLVALFVLILGFAFCVPYVVRAIAGPLAAVAGRLGGSPARMAVDGIRASLSRTGVAIVALAVAVSATVGVSVMVDSFRLAVSDWLGNTLRSDVYVGVASGSLDQGLLEELVAVDGIEEYSTSRRVWLESEAGRTRVIALSMASESYAGTRLIDADPEEAWPAFDDDEAVIVSEPYAYRHRVERGDRLSLRTDRGMREFAVAGTYRSYDANQGAVVMSRKTYDRHWSDAGVDSLGLYLGDGADAETVMDSLRALSEGRQAIRMSSNADLKEISLAIFDRTFTITNVLYWLAVGVAVIGILGAMLALQLERARDLAVLRAIGMTPAQLGGMVTLQTATIGLLSGLAALPLGLLMAWVLIDVINRRSFGWQMAISVDPMVAVTAVGLATSAALFAGLYPAWRAAMSSPAAAMREE